MKNQKALWFLYFNSSFLVLEYGYTYHSMHDFALTTYDYDLPPELIAQEAVHPADRARLLVAEKESGTIIADTDFASLPDILPSDRILFFNNSKVLRSRIPLHSARFMDPSGRERIVTEGEIFFLKMQGSGYFEALVRPWKLFRIGTRITIDTLELEVSGVTDVWRMLRICAWSIWETMERIGRLPLPPYIAYDIEKEQDYQTQFAQSLGSVAAPTASLHFTSDLLERLPHERAFVTLHVWLGTFKGIDVEDVRDYSIHGEIVEVWEILFTHIASWKLSGKKVLAVGTTVCRTLESLPFLWRCLLPEEKMYFSEDVRAFWDGIAHITDDRSREWTFVTAYEHDRGVYRFETHIYIFPWYTFRVVDELITNFHLPRSSLLVLVSAFSSMESVRRLYRHAIDAKYRFYSFGDGMYLRWK